MYVLDNGKIVMSGNNNVTLDGSAGREAPAIPIHTFLLDTETGYILFDCACDPEGVHGVWPEWLMSNPYVCPGDCELTTRLGQIGIKPEEVKTVVLSHMHMDHAGDLKSFPGADVYVQDEELTTVLKSYAKQNLEGTFHLKSDVENILKAGVHWRPVPADVQEMQLCKGVTILNFGRGHSFGMLGLLVELQCKTFLLAADAVYSRVHYGPPAQMAGVCAEEDGYFKTIEWIREYAAKHDAQVLFGHDMEQFQSLKKAPEYYE